MLVAMLGYIPIILPLLAVFCPLFGSIPMMLFMTKVKKFGMITLMCTMIGIFLWITGMGYWPFLFRVVCGFLTDLLDKSGNYHSAVKTVIGNDMLHLTIFANLIPPYTYIDGYFSTRQDFGQEYITSLANIMQPWTALVLLLASFVCGVIGRLIGQKLLKMHFAKAGIV